MSLLLLFKSPYAATVGTSTLTFTVSGTATSRAATAGSAALAFVVSAVGTALTLRWIPTGKQPESWTETSKQAETWTEVDPS